MKDKSPTEIRLKQSDESITIEMYLPLAAIIEHLKLLGVYRETRSHYQNLAAYYQSYNRKIIPAGKIRYIKADRTYCIFYLCDGSNITQSKPMGYFLENYYTDTLVRIHNTYAVNKDFIKRITSGYVLLNDNNRLPVGRKHKIVALQMIYP
ncbi:MAG: LytTR family transcriptional regulator [Prevotella sp.]|jgi:DNA-binding LytR/AlgR family response regulator|nr:LytTR family transcriptional regulator [Prevotella sp.]